MTTARIVLSLFCAQRAIGDQDNLTLGERNTRVHSLPDNNNIAKSWLYTRLECLKAGRGLLAWDLENVGTPEGCSLIIPVGVVTHRGKWLWSDGEPARRYRWVHTAVYPPDPTPQHVAVANRALTRTRNWEAVSDDTKVCPVCGPLLNTKVSGNAWFRELHEIDCDNKHERYSTVRGVRSVTECQKKCREHAICGSVRYYSGSCHLLTECRVYVRRTNWALYMRMHDFHESQSTTCADSEFPTTYEQVATFFYCRDKCRGDTSCVAHEYNHQDSTCKIFTECRALAIKDGVVLSVRSALVTTVNGTKKLNPYTKTTPSGETKDPPGIFEGLTALDVFGSMGLWALTISVVIGAVLFFLRINDDDDDDDDSSLDGDWDNESVPLWASRGEARGARIQAPLRGVAAKPHMKGSRASTSSLRVSASVNAAGL